MKLYAHSDADGITGAYFVFLGENIDNVIFPEEFGDVSGWQEDDIMIDMKPNDESIKGLVIDHHPGHKNSRNYTLIYSDIKPASLLAFEQYKSKIPEKEWWKLAVGLSGDGAINMLPYDVYKNCRELTYGFKTWSGTSYGQERVSFIKVYKLLSSNINLYARINKPDLALRVLSEADSPLDLLENEETKALKENLSKTLESIKKDTIIYELPNLVFLLYSSNLRIGGIIASTFESSLNKTIIAVEKNSGKVSARGDLVFALKDYLENKKASDLLKLDGHPGFMGGKCNVKKLRQILEILERF